MRVKRPKLGLTVAGVVVAIMVAACGGSGKSSGGASSTPGSSSGHLTKTPIKIMAIGEFTLPGLGVKFPQWPAAAQAETDAVNAAGGIHGHPLVLLACDLALSVNNGIACAHKAIADHVAAVTGSQMAGEEPYVYPLLAKAGIPMLGGQAGVTTLAYTEPNSFPFTSGSTGDLVGMGDALVKAGATKTSILTMTLPDINGPISYWARGVQAAGATVGQKIVIPTDATDMGPYVAKATGGGVKAVSLEEQGAQFQSAANDLRSAGATVSAAATTMTPQVIHTMGAVANGIYVVSYMAPPHSNAPGSKMFLADMQKYSPSLVSQVDDNSEDFWAAAWVFSRVADKLPTVTAASMMNAMKHLTDFNMGGLTPPLTTTKASTAFPGLPRMYNPTVTIGVVKDGKIVPSASGFVPVSAKG